MHLGVFYQKEQQSSSECCQCCLIVAASSRKQTLFALSNRCHHVPLLRLGIQIHPMLIEGDSAPLAVGVGSLRWRADLAEARVVEIHVLASSPKLGDHQSSRSVRVLFQKMK